MTQPDLFADTTDETQTGGSEFGARVNAAIESLTGNKDLSIVNQFDRSIATPSDLKSSGWTEDNSPLGGNSDWSFDEHMGDVI